MAERESVRVLDECIALQKKKSADYQNPNSTVKQADYYPNGVQTIHDILHAKMLRAKSLLESGATPNNESLEDTYKDLINYASFAVAWIRGGIPGQGTVDIYNRPAPGTVTMDAKSITYPNIESVPYPPESEQEACVTEVQKVQSPRERATAPRVPSTSSSNMYR